MRLTDANKYLAQEDYARSVEIATDWPIVTPKNEVDDSEDQDGDDPRGGPSGGPAYRRPSRRKDRGDTPSDTDHDQGSGHGKRRTAPYRELHARTHEATDYARCYHNQDQSRSSYPRSQELDQENQVARVESESWESRIGALPSILDTVE